MKYKLTKKQTHEIQTNEKQTHEIQTHEKKNQKYKLLNNNSLLHLNLKKAFGVYSIDLQYSDRRNSGFIGELFLLI